MSLLFGGTTRGALRRPELRRIVAYAAHEMSHCFRLASRKSESWRPSLASVCSLSPKLFEAVLLAPSFVFELVCRLGLLPLTDIPAAGRTDITNGKEPPAVWNLQNVVKIADMYESPMPLCKALLAQLQSMRCRQGSSSTDSSSLQELLAIVPPDFTFYRAAVPRWARVFILRLGIAFLVLVVAVIIPLLRIS